MNREYTIYFEIFGKRMKTDIIAESEAEAIQKLKNKIEVIKIEPKKDEFNAGMNLIDGILNGFKKTM